MKAVLLTTAATLMACGVLFLVGASVVLPAVRAVGKLLAGV